MSRFKRALNRSKYAAVGAAIGAGIGGLISRNAASTGGGLGALVGAIYGEKRVDFDSFIDGVREEGVKSKISKPAEATDD